MYPPTISSRSFGVFFAGRTDEHLTVRSLSVCRGEPLLVPYNALLYSIVYVQLYLIYDLLIYAKKTNKKALHPTIRTKSVVCSRVATCIYQYLTILASVSMYKFVQQYACSIHTHTRLRRFRRVLVLSYDNFFSQLQDLLHDWLTCRHLSFRPLSGRNG